MDKLNKNYYNGYKRLMKMIIMMIKHLSEGRCFLSFIRVKNPHKNALKRHKNHMDNIALLC